LIWLPELYPSCKTCQGAVLEHPRFTKWRYNGGMARRKVSVKFQALSWQVKTLQKGNIFIVLSVGEDEIQNVSNLLSHKQKNIGLDIIASPIKLTEVENAKKGKDNQGRKTKPQRRRWKPD
jgi:hypothetical protein